MIRAISAGRAGFHSSGAIGSLFRMASNVTAVVGPVNGKWPVVIS